MKKAIKAFLIGVAIYIISFVVGYLVGLLFKNREKIQKQIRGHWAQYRAWCEEESKSRKDFRDRWDERQEETPEDKKEESYW